MKFLLIFLLLSIPCTAQTAKVVEVLPEDSFIVSIDGKNYRAINADKVREIEKRRIDLETAQKVNAELSTQIKEALLERDLARERAGRQADKVVSLQADFDRAQADAKRNYSLFIGERTLRQEATQFIPHGEVKGFSGRFLKFLDSGYGQSLFKLVIPTAQAGKVFFGRCYQ